MNERRLRRAIELSDVARSLVQLFGKPYPQPGRVESYGFLQQGAHELMATRSIGNTPAGDVVYVDVFCHGHRLVTHQLVGATLPTVQWFAPGFWEQDLLTSWEMANRAIKQQAAVVPAR